MSVDSDTSVGTHPVPPALRAAGTPDAAERLLARLTVLPSLLALSFLLVAFPLLLLGWFKPLPVLGLAVLAAALVVPLGMRAVRRCSAGGPARRTPWWALVALVAVAAGFGVDQALFHSQFIFVTRDPASYMQFAAWIERHGSLPITPSAAPFGGRGTGGSALHFGSWAFYESGDVVNPQFMAGLPMVLSVGYWLGGVKAAFLMAPLLGAAGVLTFGGLVARLVGARWAPLAALALALSLPDEFTARSTYSETLTQVLFIGGMCLLIDALRSGGPATSATGAPASGQGTSDGSAPDAVPLRVAWLSAPRILAALAGLCLGVNFLVRVDAPSDMLLLVPFSGYLLLRRRPQAVPLIAGLVTGLAYGAVDGWFLSRQYLAINGRFVKEMTVAFAAAAVVTAAAVLVLRHRAPARFRWPRWLATVAAAVPFAVVAAGAVRPYVQTDYHKLADAPFSLHWVYWYAGGPVILAATIGAAVLIRRCLRGEAPDWLAPLLVFCWTSAVFLYRPAITPDQPWGSRRLVPAVLPGLFLLATWFAAWLTRRARGLRIRPVTAAPGAVAVVLVTCCALGLVVPAAKTTFNLRAHYVGGIRLTAHGWATSRVYAGQLAALRRLCAAIPPDSSVLFVNTVASDELMEAVRGMCGVPVASLRPADPANVKPKPANVRVAMQRIEHAGRRPVLLAMWRDELNHYPKGTVKKVLTLKFREDQHAMDRPPTGTWAQSMTMWMWEAK